MVQLVFVHGVGTRSDDVSFKTIVENRDLLFRSIAFAGQSCTIRDPVWGDDAQKWAWNEASLPFRADRKTVESFSLSGGLVAPLGVPTASGAVAAVAQVDPAMAIDTLFAAAVEKANADGVALDARQLSEFKAAAQLFLASDGSAEVEPALAPFAAATDDAAIAELRGIMGVENAFGFGDYLRDAASTVAGAARNIASTGFVDLFRDTLNPAIGRFMGDIFVYLRSGSSRASIRKDVANALIAAWDAAKAANEPLVLIGHSLGGVILYDLLSSPQAAGLPDEFKAAVLVTVGSQVGVFEEFKLYDASAPGYAAAAGNKVPALKTIGTWMNVFDPVDLLSFRCEPIFTGVEDFMFSSATGLTSAHTAYFSRPRFHARLRARLGVLGS